MFGFQPIPLGAVAAGGGGGGTTTATFGTVGLTWTNGGMLAPPATYNGTAAVGRDGGAFNYWNAGQQYSDMAVVQLIPGAVANWNGMANGATPATANLTFNFTNNVIAGKGFDVVVRGIEGGTTAPTQDGAILGEFTTAVTPSQTVDNTTTSLTFDVTGILAEIAGDGSWNATRNVYFVIDLVSAVGTVLGFPSNETSKLSVTGFDLTHDL